MSTHTSTWMEYLMSGSERGEQQRQEWAARAARVGEAVFYAAALAPLDFLDGVDYAAALAPLDFLDD